MTASDKITAALPIGWTEADFRALGLAALDQGGVSANAQARIAKIIGACVDCQLEAAAVNDRCEPCAEQYDDDRLEMARDMAIDRHIDELRGK
jgi:hypothetical protein